MAERAGAFGGIPPEALAFYAGLEADNSKAYWQAHRDTYQQAVRAPFEAMLAGLADEFGPFHVFRPYKDVRFAKDKSPYKTNMGAYGEREGGAGFYVELSARGMGVGAGYYAMAADQLARLREAVDRTATGEEVAEITAALARQGYRIGAISELKTAPRGYPKDHPRIELLRRKGLMAFRDLGAPKWLHTRRVEDRVRDVWRGVEPLNTWLDAHVGPSTLPPDDL
jgi:uncharacterized protein (TIGR02453 family)